MHAILCEEQCMGCLDPCLHAHGTIHGLRVQSTDYCAKLRMHRLCRTIYPPNSIRDVVFSAAQSAPSKEMPNLITDSLSRPADVFLPTWSSAALDVHVNSPLQQQTLGEAAPLQAMLCKLVFSGSWPPTSQTAEWSLSHSW